LIAFAIMLFDRFRDHGCLIAFAIMAA